jgi:acetylglutamate kinase
VQDLIAKASTLLEALPYIQKFSGETFVVKYGGSFMDSPDANVRKRGARHCFPGSGGNQSHRGPRRGQGHYPRDGKSRVGANFIQGQRVTDEATVKIVDDVLSRVINPEVVETINAWVARRLASPGRTFSNAGNSGSMTRIIPAKKLTSAMSVR